MNLLKEFYFGKKVLLTGHTGFKGSWMTLFLIELGAEVIGYALDPKTNDDLFVQAEISGSIIDIRGDVQDKINLERVIKEYKPEIILHFAAQPLVIDSYNDPYYTWNVNLMGTLNLLESVRTSSAVKSVVIITTDKVYENQEKLSGYIENDPLGGHDPYSSSKAAVEIAVSSWRDSFLLNNNIGIATARAGNVIGGGDWSENRLVPDFYRAYYSNKSFLLRNPQSIRPWQHVLDVLYGYLLLARKLYISPLNHSTAYNFGPEQKNSITTEQVINRLSVYCPDVVVTYSKSIETNHTETSRLLLDSSKSLKLLQWENLYSADKSLELTNDYYINNKDKSPRQVIIKQINDFMTVYYDRKRKDSDTL